jgi:hypothetical protein
MLYPKAVKLIEKATNLHSMYPISQQASHFMARKLH